MRNRAGSYLPTSCPVCRCRVWQPSVCSGGGVCVRCPAILPPSAVRSSNRIAPSVVGSVCAVSSCRRPDCHRLPSVVCNCNTSTWSVNFNAGTGEIRPLVSQCRVREFDAKSRSSSCSAPPVLLSQLSECLCVRLQNPPDKLMVWFLGTGHQKIFSRVAWPQSKEGSRGPGRGTSAEKDPSELSRRHYLRKRRMPQHGRRRTACPRLLWLRWPPAARSS